MDQHAHRSDEPPLPLAEQLREDVITLSTHIGERNLRTRGTRANLMATACFLDDSLRESGHTVSHQRFLTDGTLTENLQVELPGARASRELIVLGAHYDTAHHGSGAPDSSAGVAVLLALARTLTRARLLHPVRLVFFVNGEPPHARTARRGSMVHAAECRRRRERIRAVVTLACLGRRPLARRGVRLPIPVGDLAVVGNLASLGVMRRVHGALERSGVPNTRVLLPEFLPAARASDPGSFWQHGFPALMLTDVAPVRSRHHHRPSDTADTVDHLQLARVTRALVAVVVELGH